MKSHIFIGYLIIALIVSVYFKGCSNTSDRSYPFNLGKAVMWPITIFMGH